MPEPIDDPAAWRGAQLMARDDWLHELTPVEQEELRGFQSTGANGASEMPELTRRLVGIQQSLEQGSGASLVRGFPISEFDDEAATRVFENIVRYIGTPVSQSAAGETIFHVRDEGYQVGHPKARGPNTKKRLSFHTDRCDVIAFLCIRQAKSGGDNQVVSSIAVYNEMLARRPDLVDELMLPFYMRRHNVDVGNQQPWRRQPVFSFCEGQFACSYLRVLIDRAYDLPELPDMTAKQRQALDYLEQVSAKPEMHVRFQLEPGDMLFLNNWVTLHRRDEFEDYEDPTKRRHLLRAWLAVPNSRPIDPLFADNFGATSAGAVRGGMRPAE